MKTMNDHPPTLTDLLADAQLMLNTLRNVDSHIFRKVAASSLVTIAAKLKDHVSEEIPFGTKVQEVAK